MVLPAFGGDVVGAVFGAGATTVRHHDGPISTAVGPRAGQGMVSSLVGRHRLGNSSALPAVVT